jgi:predicted nucleic acid-binding protein
VLLAHRSIYLDANVFIYAAEAIEPYASRLAPIFHRIHTGEVLGVTSELTVAEVLVMPIKEQRDDLRQTYEAMLYGAGPLQVIPVDRAVLMEAARLRAESKLRLPDAIHGASARLAQCTALITNDLRLASVPGLDVVQLTTLSGS